MKVRISRSLLDRIVALAAAEKTEICGLLLGRSGCCETILPAANIASDPATHFEIDPSVLISAHKAARAGGPTILGYYHSHPSGVAQPSAVDANAASPDGSLWLIAGAGDVKAWRAGNEGLHGRFLPEILDVI